MNRIKCIMTALNKNKAMHMAFKGIVASLLGALIVACSACGGGGGGSPASQPQPAPTPPKAVLIEAYGDSTMWGYDPTTTQQTANNTPALLQADLRSTYGPTVTVSNQGVSSTTLGELMQGSDGQHLPWMQVVANSKAQIVIENFGLNDVLPTKNETAAQFQADVIQWIAIARAGGKTVVIEEPNPTCGDPARSSALDQYVAIIDAVAAQQQVPLIKQYDYIKSLPNWQAMLPDCIHPSDALYKIKEQNELPVISQIVKGLI